MWLVACYVAKEEFGGGGGGGQLGCTKDNVELREGIVMYVKRGQGPKGKETHTYIYILYIHNIG